MVDCRNVENLNIDDVINDIMYEFENSEGYTTTCKKKDSLHKTIVKIVKSILNPRKKNIYKRIAIFPYKYPHDLDEYIISIGKIDNIVFYQAYRSARSFIKPGYLYIVEYEIHRYYEVLKYSPFSYWTKRQCEIGYRTASSLLKGFKLPEFSENEEYFYMVDRYRIKKRKGYAIIETFNGGSVIVSSQDDYVIVPQNIFKRFEGKRHDGKSLICNLKKEILLNEI